MQIVVIERSNIVRTLYILLIIFFLGCSKKVDVVAVTPPAKPTGVFAIAGDAQASISFSAPTNNGGANIIGYTVISTPGNITATGLQSPITVIGLTNGITYSFNVVATNSAGIGESSASSNLVTPSSKTIVNKTCSILTINRYNNGTISDYAMTVSYDFINRPIRMVLYDSLRKTKDFDASFVYQSDAILIDQYQSFKIDPTTQQIRSFTTKEDLNNPKSDNYLYQYLYNDSGYLVTKNIYINASQKPIYITTYVYDNNFLLTGCKMVLASTNKIILESSITYETSKIVKSFIYTFPDGFESNVFSTIFNYGRKMKYPVKTMVTKLYDPSNNNLLDTWSSNFSSYTYTVDNYVSQGVQSGDLQQGFSLFYGKTSFNYLCQ